MTYFRQSGQRLPQGFRVTSGAIAASMAFVMELTLLPLLLGSIQNDLGLSVGELAWVFNAYAVAVAIAVLSSGLIGDVVDRQKLFALGVALFAIGSVLSAFSGSLVELTLSRTVQGFGGGLFSPLVPILLTQANTKRTGNILMIWGGMVGIAAALLPVFGNLILTTFGWRAMFIVFACVAGIGLICLIGSLSISVPQKRRQPNYRALLSFKNYWLLLGYIFLTYGCFTFYLFRCSIGWASNGFTSQSISVFLTGVWVSFSLFSFLLRDRIDGKGLHICLISAPLLIGASFALGASFKTDITFQILSALTAGAGLACSNSPSTHLLLRMAPPDLRAFSSSLDIIFARCGSVALVALLSTASAGTAVFAILVFSALAVLCCRFFLVVPPDQIENEAVRTAR